jgi:hypothetical protein
MNKSPRNMTTSLCLVMLSQRIDIADVDRTQLTGLVNDYGYFGAIAYLQPLSQVSSGRDQQLADKHRSILLSLSD